MKIVILLSVLTLSGGVKLPSNFQKCDRKNKADLSDCTLKAAQNGVSQLTQPYDELNIPQVEPFKLLETSINGGNGPVAVNQKFKNCDLYGISKIKLDVFQFDFEKKTLTIHGTIPEVQKECDYEMKGRILLIPINGVGNSTIVLKNLKISAVFNYQETERKGKTYINFVSGDLTMDPELVIFDFLNHMDRRLSDHLNPVLNENWEQIFKEVKSGYVEIIKQIVLTLLNNFFAKLSLEEAFDG